VVLADEDPRIGGRLLLDRQEIDGAPASQWADRVLAELASLPDVTLLPRTTVFGVFDDGVHAAVERVADHLPEPPPGQPRQRAWTIVARRTVLAAGAVERPIAFPGNDRPGVMSAAAARGYMNRYAALPGRRAVVFTAGDDGWRTAADLLAAGAEVTVVDARAEVAPAVSATAKQARQVLGGRVTGTAGGSAWLPCSSRMAGASPPTCSPSPAAGTRRCICPATMAAVRAGTMRCTPSCRGRRRPASASPAPPPAA
jgi:sarcosine oxidase subunit alpha